VQEFLNNKKEISIRNPQVSGRGPRTAREKEPSGEMTLGHDRRHLVLKLARTEVALDCFLITFRKGGYMLHLRESKIEQRRRKCSLVEIYPKRGLVSVELG
jgi:hypothetical protein